MNTRPTEVLFGATDQAIFLRDHFDKQPLVYHGPMKRLTFLNEVPEVFDIEKLLAVHSGPISAYLQGEGQEVRELEVNGEQAGTLLDGGFCLMLQDLANTTPKLMGFCHRLGAALSLPKRGVRTSIFVAPKGGVVRRHFDSIHVFTIQLIGEKTWTIAPNSVLPTPTQTHTPPGWLHPHLRRAYGGDGPLDTEAKPDDRTVVMRPGSVMHLPLGHWHETHASTFSLSLSIGFEPPVWIDLVLDGLRDRLLADPNWRRSARAGRGNAAARADAEATLRALLSDLPAALQDLDPATLIDRIDG